MDGSKFFTLREIPPAHPKRQPWRSKDMLVTIPAFGKQLQAEIPGLMGASGGALVGNN